MYGQKIFFIIESWKLRLHDFEEKNETGWVVFGHPRSLFTCLKSEVKAIILRDTFD